MKILVIEDEPQIARLLQEGLSHEGFAVDTCLDGESGSGAVTGEAYDLVILDRMLSDGVDGLSICRAMRESGNETPVIMLTAKDQIHDRVDGLNNGADDYLIKPFAFQELLARIHALLRRPPTNIGEVLSAGDLTLQPIIKEVRRAGQALHLSSTEFAILECLLRHKGMIVSKQALINNVWDSDSDVLPSTVEVFIVYVRAKVDKPFAGSRLIQTVRGFGYRIVEPR